MAIVSYLTPAEAITILDELFDKGQFASSTATEQQQALNSATIAIDNLMYLGDKAVSTQVLEFPRDDDTVVPNKVLLAVALEANMLLDLKDPEIEWETEFALSFTYAGTNSKYRGDANKSNIVSGLMSVQAYQQLSEFLEDFRNLEIDIS